MKTQVEGQNQGPWRHNGARKKGWCMRDGEFQRRNTIAGLGGKKDREIETARDRETASEREREREREREIYIYML